MGKEIGIEEIIELMSDGITAVTAAHNLTATISTMILKYGMEPISNGRDIPFDMKSIINYDDRDLFCEFEFHKEINMLEKYMRKIVIEHGALSLCEE